MLGQGTGAAASLTSYGTGLVSSSAPAPAASAVPAPSSAAPAPSSTVSVLAPTPAPGPVNGRALSVTVYSDVFPSGSGSGDKSSSSVPAPASVAEHNSRGAVSVTAYPEVLHGGMSSPVWTHSSAVAAPAPSLFQNNDSDVSVTAYPEVFHDGRYNWSAAQAPSSTVAVPSAAPATNRMLEENNAAVSVPAYPEVLPSRGDNPSSAALAVLSPAPIPLAVLTPALPPGPMLEGSGDMPSSSVPAPSSAAAGPAPSSFENNGGAVPVTAYHEVLDDSRYNYWSAAPAPSSMVAVPAPAPATSRMLEDSNGAVSVTAYPEVLHSSRDNSSSVPAHSSAVAVLSPAQTPLAVLAPGLVLEGYVPTLPPTTSSVVALPTPAPLPAPGLLLEGDANNGAVPVTSFMVAAPATSRMVEENNGAGSVTAYPEVFHSRGDNSSSAPAPSSTLTPVLAPGLMPERYMNNGVPVTAYLQAGYGREKKKPSSPPSVAASGRTLDDYAKEWAARKAASGAPLHNCELPFLTGAPNAVECHACYRVVHPSEEIKCSVSRCEQPFHLSCVVEDTANFIAESFKCPQHGCVVCKQKTFFWRCGRCTVAAHTKCAPWPVIHVKDDQGSAICWRHPSNWLLQNENADLTNNIEEAFCRLPLPYVSEEFNIDSTIRDFSAVVCKPPPYTHIRRNVYLVKKKRADSSADTGCRNCRADSVCRDDCECRGLSMSCSKNCRCSDLCSNKPFRKDKKFKIVKSEGCGWGAVALEPLEKGDFIIEYVGEVINDATCEQRLWEMKRRGDKNFYMCEISKDCTIDATFKGNTSRFLNHSCDPNCKLEKWQVEGEIRVGVFASRNIEVGEPLTYDYRFVHFGEKVKCNCGAKSCQGYLGIQLKNPTQDALAAAAALENQGDCSPSRLKPETHLLPWTNCIEVPFNLRSKTKIDRLCWGRKRQRTSIIDPSPSLPMEAAGPVPNGFPAELV